MTDNTILKVIHYLDNKGDEKDLKEIQNWIKNHKEEFETIKLIYENTPFERKEFSIEERRKYVFDKVRNDSGVIFISGRKHLNQWLKIAAVFAGLMVIAFSLYFYSRSLSFEIANQSSTNQKFILPDGSEVILDQNAVVRYRKNWLNQFEREINLTGRAYFQVEKSTSQRFVVKTKIANVEVLGTEFSVSDKYNKFQVVLNEGKVSIKTDVKGQEYVLSSAGAQIIIHENGEVEKQIVSQNLYFSWLEEKLTFDNCKVSEALDFISDSYDLNVILNDSISLEKQLIGSAPSDDPMLIIEAIAKITNHDIERKNQDIILK